MALNAHWARLLEVKMADIKKVNVKTEDVRCKICGRLLFRLVGKADALIEIKCKCKRVCKITLPIPPVSSNMSLKEAA